MPSDKTPERKLGEPAAAESSPAEEAGRKESEAVGSAAPPCIPEDATRPSLSQKDIQEKGASSSLSNRITTGGSSSDGRGGGDLSLIGEILENQYKIISILGKGGMSVVYRASHVALNKTVAIKTMHAHLISDSNALARFKQEAQAASQLDHPNVINVYSFGTTSGDSPQPYIIMDYIEGDSLSDAIKKDGLPPVRATLTIFRQVACALEHAHSKGVIHRDLKPSNIMLLARDGTVKIVDFGIAKLLPQEGEQSHRLTQTGEIFGSPAYMSPEQCMGLSVDKRSDIYALGCVLYEALTGKPPLQGNTVFETFNKHTTEIPAPLEVPGAEKALIDRLDAVVFRALEKQPDKRYQSMSAFESDLASIESELDSGLRSTGLRLGIARQQRSLKRFASSFPKLVALFILAAGIVALTGFFSWQRYSWFFEAHTFQPTATRWFYFLEARRKSNLSESEKQVQLDQGSTTLKFTRLFAGDSEHWLENWKIRAQLCARLDAPKEEIEARRNVVSLENEINGPASPSYGLASEELAECLICQGDYRHAMPLLQEALSIRERLESPAPKVNILLSYACGRSGLYTESVKQADKALRALANTDYRLIALACAIRGDQLTTLAENDAAQRKEYLKNADLDYAKAQSVLAESGKGKNLMNEVVLSRAYVNLCSGNYKEACSLYAMSMPYAEKLFSDQASQWQKLLDGYAYCCWQCGDIIKAGELHARSAALGNLSAQKPTGQTTETTPQKKQR
jgi:serine/threonine protein kinase